MNILFYDSALSGHHTEYISHLIKFLVSEQPAGKFLFVLHPEFESKCADLVLLSRQNPSIQLILMSVDENKLIYSAKNILQKSLAEYRVMNTYSLQHKAGHVFLLHLNTFQFALGLNKTAYTVSGILFKPFTMQTFSNDIKGTIQRKRKAFQTWFMLRNKRIRSILLLNDAQSCQQLNDTFKTSAFKYLPDPVPVFEADPDFNLRSYYQVDATKTIYLHAGSLEHRKGTIEIIKALSLLSPEIQQNITVLIIGKASVSFDLVISETIAENKSGSAVQLIYDNGFVTTGRLKALFEQTDLILIPYKSAEASSGILGHAILNRKLVIGPRNGLLGTMILEYKAGYVIDQVSDQEISAAIANSFDNKRRNYEEDALRSLYLDAHNDHEFARIIIAN